jgi:ADP-ribosylglycohydrolase
MTDVGERGGVAAIDDLRAKARGCLLAGAVGDALGAPVEFWSLDEIRSRCGPKGVTGYLPAYGRDGGAITDDTQMALFMAEGLLRAHVRASHGVIVREPSAVHRSLLRWMVTQREPVDHHDVDGELESGWLITNPALHHRRAPGNSCLSALGASRHGTLDEPINDSKGCGAVMRSAPVGFTLAVDPFLLAAECGAITHGHPSGHLAAGFLAQMVAELRAGPPLAPADRAGRIARLDAAIDATIDRLAGWDRHDEVLASVEAARAVAVAGRPTPERLEVLGGGWVAEEALAIGLCCALAADDLLDGLLLAVNHSGDADSTGSIAGNLLGAVHGEAAIPPHLLVDLELVDVIGAVADDLVDAFFGEGVGSEHTPLDARVQRWFDRYPAS